MGSVSSRPTVVELFAGAGLFSLAFRDVGFRTVSAFEINSVAASTFRLNLGPHVEVANVKEVQPTVPSCDVLLAGPPCQGFSTLGRRNRDDPRNMLWKEITRFARQLRPKVVVIENVAAFLGSSQHRGLCRSLRRSGYQVSSFALDAADFGVPQRRLRSFTLGAFDLKIPEPRRTRKNPTTVREAWQGLSSRPDGMNQHEVLPPTSVAIERMRMIPAGGDKRDIMERAPHLAPRSWWSTSCSATDVWGRMEWDSPANTLRTEFVNPSKGRYIHPEQHRVISLREAARLHSIPDSWRFVGKPYQVARQIGNSVPPRLGRAIARQIYRRALA